VDVDDSFLVALLVYPTRPQKGVSNKLQLGPIIDLLAN
jgi:hypothetical protein